MWVEPNRTSHEGWRWLRVDNPQSFLPNGQPAGCAFFLLSVVGCIRKWSGLYLTSPQTAPRYLELKVKSMFIVRPRELVTECIEPLTLSDATASNRRVPSVDDCSQ